MAELVTLTAPVTKPNTTTITIDRVTIDVAAKSILIQWLGNNAEAGSASYPTPAILNPLGALQPTGAVLLNQLNTLNMSTTSLIKRVLQRLQTDGYLAAGTIAGSPD
jgi:hypothetical protein